MAALNSSNTAPRRLVAKRTAKRLREQVLRRVGPFICSPQIEAVEEVVEEVEVEDIITTIIEVGIGIRMVGIIRYGKEDLGSVRATLGYQDVWMDGTKESPFYAFTLQGRTRFEILHRETQNDQTMFSIADAILVRSHFIKPRDCSAYRKADICLSSSSSS